MPNPVPLATKEEEERRAWVTAHHEVVRLVKDCFGDRFSNNEIFDRLKISRRTGYRALGNDERIGKAPGRKPKIMENTIREMIDYIEAGGCADVGNVWKHLAEKFASNCNPKTVQDAVKRSGFKNYRDTVKLEPLLNEEVAENQPAPDDDQQIQQLQQSHQLQQLQQAQQDVIDPAFQQPSASDTLRAAIENAPDNHVRFVLHDVCGRLPEAAQIATHYLCAYVAPPPPPPPPVPEMVPQMAAQMTTPQPQHGLQIAADSPEPASGKRQRLAICRRCNRQYDRAENTMDTRECLYHKGSPQKISPEEIGTIEQIPQAYIWSCCGGNGLVRGCCRAMHTTKKKRKYGKKRDATEAGLDGEDSGVEGETTMMDNAHMQDPNIDARLQDLQTHSIQDLHVHSIPAQMQMQMQIAAQMAAPQASMQSMQHAQMALQGSFPPGHLQHLPHDPQSLAPELQLQQMTHA